MEEAAAVMLGLSCLEALSQNRRIVKHHMQWTTRHVIALAMPTSAILETHSKILLAHREALPTQSPHLQTQ
jgi:hypothetical protein